MICNDVQYLAPPNVVTKGRQKRQKSSKKKAQKKPRLCRGCKKHGVSHDKHNCPPVLMRYTFFFCYQINYFV